MLFPINPEIRLGPTCTLNHNLKHWYIPRIDFQSSHSSWLLIYVRDDPLGHLLWGDDDKGEGEEEDEDEEGEGKEA